MKLTEKQIQEGVSCYWVRHFISKGCCSLCGNSGLVDTRGTSKLPTGESNGKKQHCFCPNGQALRKAWK